jgi:hypothetical protein
VDSATIITRALTIHIGASFNVYMPTFTSARWPHKKAGRRGEGYKAAASIDPSTPRTPQPSSSSDRRRRQRTCRLPHTRSTAAPRAYAVTSPIDRHLR